MAHLLLVTALRPPRPQWRGRPFAPLEAASPLERRLRPIARRLHLRRIFEHLPLAFLQLASALLIGALLMRLFDWPACFWLGLLLGLLLAVASTWQVAGQLVGPFEAARHTDTALRLRERLATALELLDHGQPDDANPPNPLVVRQIADATAAAARLEPKAAVPLWPTAGEALRRLLRRGGLASLLLIGAAVLALAPGGVSPLAPQSPQDRRLAMAEPGRSEEELAQPPGTAGGELQSVGALSQRPNEVGQPSEGLLTPPQQSQPAQAGGDQSAPADPSAQQVQQDVSSQQDASIAQRQQAVQDLGNALRQSQVARQAGESLRQGDTQRGSQQLAQVADQVSRLSPGERQTLSQALDQAAQQIGSKDQRLANQARQAAEALSQYRNRDAQQAIRDMANQVRDTGQQAQAQRDLQQRAAQLQRGGQPQLPQGSQSGTTQQGQQGQPSQQSGQGQPPREGGSAGAQDQGQQGQGDLAQLEAGLQSGGLSGNSGGTGAGTGSGADLQGPPQRLNVQGHPVEVQAEVGEGPTLWRPPSPNAPPVTALPPASATSSSPASSAPVGAGPDLNSVPRDLAGSVRQYFTPPDQPQP